MNIITHDTAYSFFPWATFEERRALMCRERTVKRNNACIKYADRGWSFVTLDDLRLQKKHAPYSSFAVGTESARASRYVGDRWCWRVPLSPVLSLAKGYIEGNSWNTDCSKGRPNNEHPMLAYRYLVSRKLKFCYVIDFYDGVAEHVISYYMGPCDWHATYEPT